MRATLDVLVRTAQRMQARMGAFPPPQGRLPEFYVGVQKYNLIPHQHRAVAYVAFGPIKGTNFASVEDYWVHTLGILGNSRINLVEKIKAVVGFERTLATYYRTAAMSPQQKEVYRDVIGLLYQMIVSMPEPTYVLPAPKHPPSAEEVLAERAVLEARLFLDPGEVDKFLKFADRLDLPKFAMYEAKLTNIIFT
jgi:hypothetical protein